MRTLVMLLVPSDEVYFALPALRALRRNDPRGDIHVLLSGSFRSEFSLEKEFYIHPFESADAAINELKNLAFDQIFNLSFSRESSLITARLTREHTRVHGYTQNEDGTLAIPDDTSAYVFAQVGFGRPNRYHRTAIAAAVIGVELTDQDLYIDSTDRQVNVLKTSSVTEAAAASFKGISVQFDCPEGISFWEKGPWSRGSQVGTSWIWNAVERTYSPLGVDEDRFGWELLQALYTSADFPAAPDSSTRLGFQRLLEVSELAIHTLKDWKRDRPLAAQTLLVVDQMLDQLAESASLISPVVRWFQTERIRIGPISEDEILQRTRKLFDDLFLIASVYRDFSDNTEQTRAEAVELCRQCGPAFREWEVSTVADEFQRLMTSIHELARHSNQLGSQPWSKVLENLVSSLDRRDYIDVADQIEFIIGPQLGSM